MANGWAKLGAALAGTSDADRAEIGMKTMEGLARRDRALAGARMDIEKAKALDSLGSYFRDLGIASPEAAAGVSRSGVNLNTLTSGLGQIQEQGFRQGARDRAVAGDYGGANAELFGVTSAPVSIPQVTGGMLLSNRLVPGGGDVSLTDVGASQVRANDARGDAALIRANRPPASRGGGGGSAPRLSEVQKARMSAELALLKPQIDVALDDIAREAGRPNSQRAAAAKARLAELQAAQGAIFDRYEGGGGAPAVNFVIDDAIPAPVAAALPSLAQQLTPAESVQLAPASPPPATRPQPRGTSVAGDQIDPRLFQSLQDSLGGVARPASKAEYDALPKGARFILPDGRSGTK